MSLTCSAQIDLATPVRRERRRGFQPPWYTVFVYRCSACTAEHHVRAGTFIGRRAVPSVGAIICGRPIAQLPLPLSP